MDRRLYYMKFVYYFYQLLFKLVKIYNFGGSLLPPSAWKCNQPRTAKEINSEY